MSDPIPDGFNVNFPSHEAFVADLVRRLTDATRVRTASQLNLSMAYACLLTEGARGRLSFRIPARDSHTIEVAFESFTSEDVPRK